MIWADAKSLTIPEGAVKQIADAAGNVLWRATGLPSGYRLLDGVAFDGNTHLETDIYLRGSDTLRFNIMATKTGVNTIGSYEGSSSDSNYSLYFTNTANGCYARYNGTLFRPTANLNTRYNVVMSPTGVTGLKTSITWTAKTFTSSAPMFIGWLDNATSPRFLGSFHGSIIIDGRAELVPAERLSDGVIGYYDLIGRKYYTPTVGALTEITA